MQVIPWHWLQYTIQLFGPRSRPCTTIRQSRHLHSFTKCSQSMPAFPGESPTHLIGQSAAQSDQALGKEMRAGAENLLQRALNKKGGINGTQDPWCRSTTTGRSAANNSRRARVDQRTHKVLALFG